MSKLIRRNQRISGLLTMIVGVLMIAGPVLADAGNGNGSEKKDDSLPAVAAAASEDKGNSGDNGNGSDKKDDAPAAAAEAPGNSGDAPGQSEDKGSDNGKGNDKKDESAPAETNGNGNSNGNGSDNSSAGGSASEDKGNGWESAPGQEGKGCDQAGQGSGPYASTCDGSPSENGNGNGGGGGKPCAGCVGNADNKNPPGQLPNGKDPNKGYECDGNNGIGKGNPAHTGCTPGNTPPPECKGKKCDPCPGNSCGGGKPDCPGNSCNPCPGKSCEDHGKPDCPGKSCEEHGKPDCPGNSCKGEDPKGPDTPPGQTPDPQDPDVIDRPGRPGKPQAPVVLADRLTRGDGSSVAARQPSTPNLLPFTGANLLIFLGTGLSLSGAGIMLNGKRK